MDHQSNQPDRAIAKADNLSASTIDFHSVIDLNGYAQKGLKLEIDSNVSERPHGGNGGAEDVTMNETVKLTEKGHPIPEHVLNKLILTEHGHDLNLNDLTKVEVRGFKGNNKGDNTAHKEVEKMLGLPEERTEVPKSPYSRDNAAAERLLSQQLQQFPEGPIAHNKR